MQNKILKKRFFEIKEINKFEFGEKRDKNKTIQLQKKNLGWGL